VHIRFEPVVRRPNFVGAGGHLGEAKAPLTIRACRSSLIGLNVAHLDRGVRDHAAAGVLNGAFEHSRLRLGRSANRAGQNAAHDETELVGPERIGPDGNRHRW
jgi:hypothetical protein